MVYVSTCIYVYTCIITSQEGEFHTGSVVTLVNKSSTPSQDRLVGVTSMQEASATTKVEDPRGTRRTRVPENAHIKEILPLNLQRSWE